MSNPLIVEVQDSQTLLWFTATIIDIQDSKLVIKYADPLFNGQEETVEERRVRWSTVQCTQEDFEFEEDSYVEVRHSSSEGEPLGW